MKTRAIKNRRPTPYPRESVNIEPVSTTSYADSAQRRSRQGIDLCMVLKDTILWKLRCNGAHWWSLDVTTIDNGMTSKGFLVKAVHPFDYHQSMTGRASGVHVSKVYKTLIELSESFSFNLEWISPSHS